MYYKLGEDGKPVAVNAGEWAEWMSNNDRSLARTEITEHICVSTVFLGLDHSYGGEGPPVLWETMIFGGLYDQQFERATSAEAAQLIHHAMVQKATAAEAKAAQLHG